MCIKVARILLLTVLLARCVENKERPQLKLKELSPYLQPPPLVKPSSTSATTKLGAVKPRSALTGKIRGQSAPEDSPSLQRVPRRNPAKEGTTDSFASSKERKNHGSSRLLVARTKLLPLNSRQTQQTASSSKRQRAILPYLPNQQILTQNAQLHHSKDCNPCNKVPWIPLLEEHVSAIDSSVSDSVGHYSHHRDLPIPPLHTASKPTSGDLSEEFALKFAKNSELQSNFNKHSIGVTYLPPSPQTPIPGPLSNYVTPDSSFLPENLNTRLTHSEILPSGPPTHNIPVLKNPGPMYRYLRPPPVVPQFPVENKFLPTLSSSQSASKTETLYGLPFFIPPRSNISTHQHVNIVEPTLTPPSIQQVLPFTFSQGTLLSFSGNAQLLPEQIDYSNRSAHSLGTKFYEASNIFPVPPLYGAHQFSQSDFNVSLPQNLVPPEISGGNVAFSTELHENVNQFSQNFQSANDDLKLLDIRGSNVDVVPSIPVSEESYNFTEVTNYSNNLLHTTVTESGLGESQPSEDQVISPSHTNQNSNTNFYNPQQPYGNPTGTQFNSNIPLQTGPNLEVIKSVQVANYISSIEYPLQVVHSPYIDINTTSIESGQNITVKQPTAGFNQYPYFNNNVSQLNLNSDTADIIVGKPIPHDNNYNNIYNETRGEYQNHIPNLEQPQTFESSGNILYKNDSSFVFSGHDSSQNISAYLSNAANTFFVGTEDYSFVENNTSKDLYQQFNSHANNTQGTNVRVVTGNNYEWYNSQYDNITEKDKDNLGENSYRISSQHIAHVSPAATPTPQVTVHIQPSVQTSALHGASLVHQINSLKHQYPPALHFSYAQLPLPYPSDSQQNFIQFPQGVPIIQQQAHHTAFRNTLGEIENMQPPPFNYIGVIKHPLAHQAHNVPASFHSSFNLNSHPSQSEYFKWTTIPGSTSAPIPTRSPIIPAWHKPTTSMPPQDSVHGQSIHTIDTAGLLPPPMQHNTRPTIPVKNPKQIQIIVPYTSGQNTHSFPKQKGRPLDIETTGWSPMTGSLSSGENKNKNCSNSNIKQISECNTGNSLNQWLQQQEDYHQHQESRTVTATASATSNPFQSPAASLNSLIGEDTDKKKPFSVTQQHILASNIQDLLRGERENITYSDTIDLKQLQKYIDEWTASEFATFNLSVNSSNAKDTQTSVTPDLQNTVVSHHLIPSKKIPAEYLTTPPSVFDDFMSAENSIATAVPRLTGKTLPSSAVIRLTSRRANSSSISSSPKETFPARSKELNANDQQSSFLKNSYFWNKILSQEIGHTATTNPTTITETTTDATTYDTTTETEMTSSTSWEDLQVSISPITKEKVYVVTPLPTWPPEPSSTPWPPSNLHKGILSNTPKTTDSGAWDRFPFRNSASMVDSLHTPRFSIRPTPGTTMQRSFTVTNDDNDPVETKVTTFYPAENEISYTYDSRENGNGDTSRSGSSTRRSTVDTALWSLTDLPTYTPPAGERIHTYSGHSRVVTTPTMSTAAPRQRDAAALRQPVGILKKYQPDRHSYLWHFPELLAPSGEELRNDEAAAVHSAIVELRKETKH